MKKGYKFDEGRLVFLLHSEGGKNGVPFSIGTIPSDVLQTIVDDMPKVLCGSSISGRERAAIRESLCYSFSEGSLKVGAVVAAAGLAVLEASSFASDMQAIAEHRLADVVDRDRLSAIGDMRDVLKKHGASSFGVSSEVAKVSEVNIIQSELNAPDDGPVWVDSDAYVLATVTDLGGKSSSNAHLELEDGQMIKADTSRSYLFGLQENMMYKQVVAHVSYPLNVHTREWDRSQVKLISIELPNTSFDRAAFDIAISGKNGWRDVADPVAEIRRMRSANG